MKTPVRIQNALEAIATVKKLFWHSAPVRKAAPPEDGFGNPAGGRHFKGSMIEEGPKPPETPQGFKVATIAGGALGSMVGGGVVVQAVMAFGTATPFATSVGGVLLAGIGAAGGAFMGPWLAVMVGAPIAAAAALAGIKTPDVKMPDINFSAATVKLTALSGKMKTAFQARAAKAQSYLNDMRKPKPPAP